MEYDAIEALAGRNASWRLLRAVNAPLILAFLGDFFVEGNRGARPASEVSAALDDALYAINAANPTDVGGADPRYPKPPEDYLRDWSAAEAGYLRRFYPPGDEEVHYEATPGFEKAYAWVTSLRARTFVGTESRLHTVVALLRQIVHGTEEDPAARLRELHRRRAEIDAEITEVEAGHLVMLDDTGIRDRYQQFSTTARELLADFREVEENFRTLDRAAREKIAAWTGSKGDLLADLVGSRSEISGTDQGRSFQAFYDYLLSQTRQDELAELLRQVSSLAAVDQDERIRGIQHHWSEAAERAQRTVRQISEQLRRFLDEAVWVENRRVVDLIRAIEATAIEVRAKPPTAGLTIDGDRVEIALPVDRPLYRRPETPDVHSLIPPTETGPDTDVLMTQNFIDVARLADRIRSVLPARAEASLDDITAMFPIEQGAAEIVGYLSLTDDDISVEIAADDGLAGSSSDPGTAAPEGGTTIDYVDPYDTDMTKRAHLPKVTVRRT